MEHSLALLREAFLSRLTEDYFGDLALGGGSPGSIRQFIDFLTAGNATFRAVGFSERTRFPDLTDLNMPFEGLLQQLVRIDGRDVEVSAVFRDIFCAPVATRLVFKVASDQDGIAPSTASGRDALGEVGANTWREWAHAMERPDRIELIAEALYEITVKELTPRPLISFFIKNPVAGKFSMWGPGASSGEGRKLPIKVIECDGYSVTVRVSRYEEVECNATAYEWDATLTMAGASEPDAAACGMVYVFKREGGELVGGLEDLVIASDSMADTDVIQVKSFITQHDDAADIIEESDLCFVWLWERRGGTSKGLGAQCLTPALRNLRERFKKVRTVVFDARPGQFSNWTSRVDPPMVALEKQTAVENLVSYIHGLKLDFDTRAIFARSDNPFQESLAALGQAVAAARDHDGDDDESIDDEIDLDGWQEEIADLLRVAGLEELAYDFDLGQAAYDEVLAALKHIVFDQHVHYLRPSSSGKFDSAYVAQYERVPFDEAYANIAGVSEFCAALPTTFDVIAVYWLDDYAVCTVRATTPFGDLTEHYSLVRKPRPINVESFFDNLN